jgi:plastocyanin
MSNSISAILIVLLLAASSAAAAEFKIIQKNMEFSLKETTIKVGDTLNFINADIGTHNIYSSSEIFSFDLEAQQPGTSKAVRFTKAGVFELRCAMHPRMRLKVTVTP